MKINTDAAIGKDGWIGIGAVMQDEGGHIVTSLMTKVRGLLNVFHGEVIAIKENLHLIQEVNLENIIIQSDARTVSNALANSGQEESETTLNIRHIQSYVRGLS